MESKSPSDNLPSDVVEMEMEDFEHILNEVAIHCVVIFSWSSGIVDWFGLKIELCSCARGVIGVASLLQLINSFSESEATNLPMQEQAMLPEDFFSQI